MIRKLTLRNFQSHEDLEIELGSVTSIVGPSDVGKSAILRALRWVALNKPRGDAFVKDGAKETLVRVETDKGIVERRRGSQKNLYRVEKRDLVAFGHEVPEEVDRVLGLGEINFQGQHDPPYWFSLSPGQVSKQINEIVDLDLVDRTLANLASKIRKTKTMQEACRARLEEARARRKALSPVGRAAQGLKHLETLEWEQKDRAKRAGDLSTLLAKAEEQRDLSASLHDAHKNGCRVRGIGKKAKAVRKSRVRLWNLISSAIQYRDKIECPPEPTELGRLCSRLLEIHGVKESLAARIQEIERAKRKSCRVSKDLKGAKARFESELGETCPLCGQEIP